MLRRLQKVSRTKSEYPSAALENNSSSIILYQWAALKLSGVTFDMQANVSRDETDMSRGAHIEENI